MQNYIPVITSTTIITAPIITSTLILSIKNWVEINYKLRGTCYEDNQIRFKTSMFRSRLCDYSDAYILVIETVTVTNTAAQGQPNNSTKKF